MAVITISRQYGSGGSEIAAQVCKMLGYRFFDKVLMTQVAAEAGIAEGELVDFSEDTYKIRGFLDRLFGRSRQVGRTGTWKTTTTGVTTKEIATVTEDYSITLIQGVVQSAYEYDNVVIVGRGGQAILKDKTDVLHVRIEASLSVRNQRLHARESLSLAGAQDVALKHDRASADYLRRFYNIDWTNPMLYDLVINTNKLSIDAAAHLIVNAVSYIRVPEHA